MSKVFLACEAVKTQLEAAKAKYNCSHETVYFDSGLHVRPEKLKQELEKCLFQLKDADIIYLVMGVCGNSFDGIYAPTKIIVPKVDDCITMLLTTTEVPNINLKQTGHMYMTKGMIDLANSENSLGLGYEDLISKFGEKKGKRIYKLTYDSYKFFDIIDDGTYPVSEIYEETEKMAKHAECDLLIAEGSNIILEKLCRGDVDAQFVIFEKGALMDVEAFL